MSLLEKPLESQDRTNENLKGNEFTISYLDNSNIDPVLLDITNLNANSNNSEQTPHEILRESARQNLQIYTDKMVNQMNKGKKRTTDYQIGDLVRIAIPKIDRFSIDRPTLPCKILEKTENSQYRVGSKFGIIEICYSAGELESLGAKTFSELDEIPTNKITIREAARLQSAGSVSGGVCNCKSECNSNRCRCKRMNENCNSRCHGGRSCKNKS